MNIKIAHKDIEKILKVTKEDISVSTRDKEIILISKTDNTPKGMTIVIKAEGEVIEAGISTIKSEVLSNIAKNSTWVTITENKITTETREIGYLTNKNSLEIPVIGGKITEITNNDFYKVLDVEFAIAQDETRPILNTVLVDSENVVALDGCRLAIRSHKGNYNKVLIHKDLIKLYKKFKNKGPVKVYQIQDQQTLEFDNVMITGKTEEGTFVNYKSLINLTDEIIAKVNATELVKLLKTYKKVNLLKLEFIDDKLQLEVKSTDMVIKDNIQITKEGKDLELAVNIKYLIESLSKYESPELNMSNNVSPIYIKEGYKLDLVLPVRFMKK